MKTKSSRPRKIELAVSWGTSYYKWAADLEKILRQKPRALRIDIIGSGEVDADAALVIRAALKERSPKTRLITHARSSLQGGAVMIWLLGDTRTIRDDARLFFRAADLPEGIEVDPNGDWNSEAAYRDSFSDADPDEGDYARVLQVIDEYLPVKEFAGRLIGAAVLKQFNLIENEKVDGFLATAFAKSQPDLVFR